MFRALYDYKNESSNFLSFIAGDQFTELERRPGGDWYLAQNGFGEIGYIPANYVEKDEASESEVLKSIDCAIEIIHHQANSSGGQYTHLQRENLKKLIQHRKNMIESYRRPESSQTSSVLRTSRTAKEVGIQKKRRSSRRVAPPPPTRDTSLGENVPNQVKQPMVNQMSPTEARNPTNKKTNLSQRASTELETLDQNEQQPAANFVSSTAHLNEKQSTEASKPSFDEVLINKSDNQTINVDTIDCATSPFPSPSKQNAFKSELTDNNQSNVIDCRTIPVPNNLGSELIEEVRRNTGLSYKNSGVAVETVLGHLGMRLPEMAALLDKVYKTIYENDVEVQEEDTSSDYERLCELFTEMTACKDDSQQRGWALHEDESIISSNLEELVSILENAKQSVARKAVASENYECIHNLVEYYQMETRVNLRLLLLQVFGAMCSLDGQVVSLLLFSILTTELAEELQRNIDDVQRVSYVLLVLTMLFCTGESVPANIHDHLSAEFLHFVFDTMDNPPSADHEEQVTDLLVNLVLAFNLHFPSPADNLVMNVIAKKGTVKVFTEKVLLLFNRDQDPVHMFDREPPPNSVLKLLQDMYSSTSTAQVLYTNDAKVLIDIVLRHLIDLSPGDKARSSHLKLMQLYLQNADYDEHRHRFQELDECLHRIQVEEETTGDDKHIVADIFAHVPIFTQS